MDINIFDLLDKQEKAIKEGDKETIKKCEEALKRWNGRSKNEYV